MDNTCYRCHGVMGQQHSATVEIPSVRRTADALEASGVITNLAGHE